MTVTAGRLGYWSSIAVVMIGGACVITLGFGPGRHGLREPGDRPGRGIDELLVRNNNNKERVWKGNEGKNLFSNRRVDNRGIRH